MTEEATPSQRSEGGPARNDGARRDRLLTLIAERHLGVLVTQKRDGRAQLSNVAYAYAHDGADGVIRISVTDDRAKTANLRRDPRASFHVTTDDFWAYTVIEGTASLTPVAMEPDDATVEELVALFRAVQGEHRDWDEFRAAMVDEGRLVVRVPVEHVYGQTR
jgi:PPOX class probable F420-dependent enzyme